MKFSHAFAASALALLSCSAQAGVISTGPATGASVLCIANNGCTGGAFTAYEQFSLAEAGKVTAIDWIARLQGGAADFRGARATIYGSDPALGSAAPLHVIAPQMNPLLSNSELFADAFTITLSRLSIELAAGDYWIGMQNLTGQYGATMACSDCTFGSYTQGLDNSNEYYQRRGDLAFRVTIPEPATVGLMALGLMGFAASRRRRKHG